MWTLAAIVLGTFVSEDLTCIATGLLIQRGGVGLTPGIVACTFGILVGDIGLWALGRAGGRAALAWPWMAKRLSSRAVDDARVWLERHAAGAIVGSRFVPGTRFALFVVAGVLRLPLTVFTLWALTAAILWTPPLVLLTATLGDAFATGAIVWARNGAVGGLAIAAGVVVLVRAAIALGSPSKRVRIAARLARWSRWEFWPMWLFYAPVGAWVAMLALRYRGLATITAANPGMPDGGTVGESKFEILSRLPTDAVVPSAFVRPGVIDERVASLRAHVERDGWTFPLVVKPDIGQRGSGVRLARTWSDVREYLQQMASAVVAQPYHPGPYEAGVFYYRMPGAARGRIFSITDKRFPVVTGDGVSTLERLIWAHPRYRMQGETFVARHAETLTRVPAMGERIVLAIAGNHAQGTLFRDGAHLVTPALERRIDSIAQQYPGFFVGRFDIRYRDTAAFMAGADLAIVELNGATAESTNIYDPSLGVLNAYRVLFRQWAIVFAIGAANRRAGAAVTPVSRLAALVRAHLTTKDPLPVSD